MSTESELEKYCGFKINGENFAIPVMEVQEVIKPQVITPVPLSPKFILGLINLRGQIVTCICLKTLFDLDGGINQEYMNIIIKGEEGLFSLLVDEVTDIIEFELSNIEAAPETINPDLRKFVKNIYKSEEGLTTILDVEKLVDIKEETIHKGSSPKSTEVQ
jgi:purine-binding chemotaxis protein CheW